MSVKTFFAEKFKRQVTFCTGFAYKKNIRRIA